MKRFVLWLFLLFWLFGCSRSEDAAKDSTKRLCFLRHSETIADVSHDFRNGFPDIFTKNGITQSEETSKLISDGDFELLLTGPNNRSRSTLYPYLFDSRAKATIWPELAECCFKERSPLPGETTPIRIGSRIYLDPGMDRFFTFRSEEARNSVFPVGREGEQTLVELAAELLRETFFRANGSVLVIVPPNLGSYLVETLLGLERGNRLMFKPLALTCFTEGPTRTLELTTVNGQPCTRGGACLTQPSSETVDQTANNEE
ncbi:MAG: hypothetical protein KDD64_15185 [Bdellovibrionales bacterium]|nr:hypothetical protein [Bdellovibrionales bacterium]